MADVDGNQAAGKRRLVDTEAGHGIDLGIEPSVMVAEETDLRADALDQVIEPR